MAKIKSLPYQRFDILQCEHNHMFLKLSSNIVGKLSPNIALISDNKYRLLSVKLFLMLIF